MKKKCDSGDHEVDVLWIARRKPSKENPEGVLSACAKCAKKDKADQSVYSEKKLVKSAKTVSQSKATSLPAMLKLAQIVFNKWIRKRDSYNGRFFCICCEDLLPADTMDAAHYMNAGNHSATRFDEDNVHGCCQICNRFLDGNLRRYRVNLIKKIGWKAVEDLEQRAIVSKKWDRSELEQIIQKFKF